MTQASKTPSSGDAPQLERQIAHDYFVRFHMSVILAAVISSGVLTSKGLMILGVSLTLRYPISVLASYCVFLLLVRVWIWYVSVRVAGGLQIANLHFSGGRGSGRSGSLGGGARCGRLSQLPGGRRAGRRLLERGLFRVRRRHVRGRRRQQFLGRQRCRRSYLPAVSRVIRGALAARYRSRRRRRRWLAGGPAVGRPGGMHPGRRRVSGLCRAAHSPGSRLPGGAGQHLDAGFEGRASQLDGRRDLVHLDSVLARAADGGRTWMGGAPPLPGGAPTARSAQLPPGVA